MVHQDDKDLIQPSWIKILVEAALRFAAFLAWELINSKL